MVFMLHEFVRRATHRFVIAIALAAALLACGGGSPLVESAAASVATGQANGTHATCGIVTTERVVAIGDVHGAFDKFVAILREAMIIDQRSRWIGDKAILVQTGDITDRGPDSKKVLDLLRKLTEEAAKAGGQVHTLLGNHEAMRVLGIYRDASIGEFRGFRTPDSENLRDRYYEMLVADTSRRAKDAGTKFDERDFRTRFRDSTPLGLVEMQLAFAPKGDYGRWLRGRDTMVMINGIVFMHGGVSPATAPMGCAAINSSVRAELDTLKVADPALNNSLSMGEDGPLWYRGLVNGTPGVGLPEVEAILTTLGARAIVVGHTVAPGFRIRPSHGGRVVQIDTGMLNGEFYPGGVPSALEIHGGVWTAIYEGRREPLQSSIPQG
jgi:3',5'-cyclic AMP phosphodiesterase CpdA